MSTGAAPVFSVIIATYNWSSALALALSSVLDQTEQDFELLVVGDACTDDSAQVVASLGDHRIRWMNLDTNCGSQWGPSNAGLSLARGRYVAYLGHDDLWAPKHLAHARRLLDRGEADVVAAGCLLYGPPGSGVRAVSGFFPNDSWTPRHFFPPSSLIHTAEAARRAGPWVGPEWSRHAVDHEFLLRLHESGARVASTGEVSVFKFNAAWRRNSYRRRDVSEQTKCLASLRREGDAFLMRELTGTLHAALEDRLVRIENPVRDAPVALKGATFNQRFKGSHDTPVAPMLIPPGRTLRFEIDEEPAGFEWHAPETSADGTRFRWIGPSREASRLLPVCLDRRMTLRIRVIHQIEHDLLARARLSINNHPVVDTQITPGEHGWDWLAQIAPPPDAAAPASELLVTITVPATHRPLDLGLNEDRRWLGLAVAWMELTAP